MALSNRDIFFKHLAIPSHLEDAPEIVKADGINLYDVNGKRYIDLVSGVTVSNLGHGNPIIKQAVKNQVDSYMHLMVYGKYIQAPQVRLAKRLSDLLPDTLNAVYFVNSGSEAIEGALKLAKRITGRSELVAFNNAYHGGTHGALSILGDTDWSNAFRPLLPDVLHLNFNDFDQLKYISRKTACVVVEPVQAEAGIILPANNYLSVLRQKCDETGAILIFDEIQMGFGRTGKLFAFEHFNVAPDILCLAKAMGAGMPIGAFISSKEKMDLLKKNPELGHITTFGGHPVSAAASLAGLNFIVDNGLHETAQKKGQRFFHILNKHLKIKEIRQLGLMLGVELDESYSIEELNKLFFKKGLIVDRFLFSHSSFRIAPPLTISNREIDETCEIIINCMDQL